MAGAAQGKGVTTTADRLLVVDDEPETSRARQGALASEGFEVIVATDEAKALEVVRDTDVDVAIVDLPEPDARGAALCRRLREARPRLPVLMVGCGGTMVERTGGLAVGADDYLAKPFSLTELLSRVRALLRRRSRTGSEVLRFADLVLDPVSHAVVRGERRLELTAMEFALLELFLHHPREVLPRGFIFIMVWGFDFGSASNALNVRIGQLRRKLEAGGEPRLIHTVRGVGYVLRKP
jgi:two-component system, OmpR family, response regulator MprA